MDQKSCVVGSSECVLAAKRDWAMDRERRQLKGNGGLPIEWMLGC